MRGKSVIGRKSPGRPVKHDKRRYTCRNRIDIMSGRLKDWHRFATHYDIDLRTSFPPSPTPQSSSSGYNARTSAITGARKGSIAKFVWKRISPASWPVVW